MNRRLAIALLVAAALAGGILVKLQMERPDSTGSPAIDAANATSLSGDVRVSFELPDVAGNLRNSAEWDGQPMLINFWATWCAPCRREIPLLQRIQREKAADGFQVIGIAVDFRDKVLAYADEMNIEYPLLIGEQDALDAAAAFGLDVVGFPFTVFTDRQGRVVVAHVGELTADEAELILGAVSEVDGGSVTPAEARRKIEAELPALAHEAGSEDG